MWVDAETAALGRGLRTSQAGIDQITTLLAEMGITTLAFDIPFGIMHFMNPMAWSVFQFPLMNLEKLTAPWAV
ncbi:MAG: hypothetical protein B6230_05640 [Desulfobacteraceae bacterium 4572_89]|nr:MAG: hypothetical protein B6230_05640 [Desulfobacteraceae bacterium 4572_89]